MRDRVTAKRDAKLRVKSAERAAERRDGSTFIALPHVVIDSPGYRRASHGARSLLIEIAARLRRKGHEGGLPNGGLMLDREFMATRGWRSSSTLDRARMDLIECGLIAVTRQGGKHRPTLYAVTWASLDVSERSYQLDIDPTKWSAVFRSAYLQPVKPEPKPQPERTAKATAARRASTQSKRGESCGPSDVRRQAAIGPSDGQQESGIRPSDGPIRAVSVDSCGPSDGHSLEHCHLRSSSRHVRQRLIGKLIALRIGSESAGKLLARRPAAARRGPGRPISPGR